jgi:hypothetical protein
VPTGEPVRRAAVLDTVFGVPADLDHAGDPVAAGSSRPTPFQLLNDTLDGPAARHRSSARHWRYR